MRGMAAGRRDRGVMASEGRGTTAGCRVPESVCQRRRKETSFGVRQVELGPATPQRAEELSGVVSVLSLAQGHPFLFPAYIRTPDLTRHPGPCPVGPEASLGSPRHQAPASACALLSFGSLDTAAGVENKVSSCFV